MEILYWPDKRLTSINSKKVTKFGDDLKAFCDTMAEVMFLKRGAGLAASQVGDDRSLFILDANLIEEIENVDYMAFINPSLSNLSESKNKGIEGCLSFPEKKFQVERHDKVTIKAVNMMGDPLEVEAEGFLARAIQHEYDHLMQVYLTDYIGSVKKELIRKSMQRLMKQK
jgi:peptide deformylase